MRKKKTTKELAETFQSILTAANKVDPQETAAYIINDSNGIR